MDRLDIVAVGIEEEGGVIAWMIRPFSGRAIVGATCSHSYFVERLDRRTVRRLEGEVMAPSMLGKLKTAIQFLAIALAILRLGDPVGGLYVDEWAMLAAAAITAWSGADYLWRALPALRRGPGLDSRIGGRLSNQALQVTFSKHAVGTGHHLRATAAPRQRDRAAALAEAYRELSYDSFRRLALAAGAPPVSSRGVVRAERAVAREARRAG